MNKAELDALPPCEHNRCAVCMALNTSTGMMSAALGATLASMRKDGQGLSHDQELTLRAGLGL